MLHNNCCSCWALNSLCKSQWVRISISPKSGAKGLQRLICYIVLKWKSRFRLVLDIVKIQIEWENAQNKPKIRIVWENAQNKPKIRIVWENAQNKSCWALNSRQKSQWAHYLPKYRYYFDINFLYRFFRYLCYIDNITIDIITPLAWMDNFNFWWPALRRTSFMLTSWLVVHTQIKTSSMLPCETRIHACMRDSHSCLHARLAFVPRLAFMLACETHIHACMQDSHSCLRHYFCINEPRRHKVSQAATTWLVL